MENIILLLIQIPVVLACLTIHEFSHGYVAYILGDDTAKRAGRLTLNPLKHLDVLGAIMLIIVKIGWAKPVPVNPYNFKDMKIGMAITAAAGPASNFLFAIIAAFLYRSLMSGFPPSILTYTLQMLVIINIALGLFNLIPFPPLDGSKIIGGFMPDEIFFRWMQWERKGAYLLMIIFGVSFLFKIPLVGTIIMPALNYFVVLLLGV